MRKPEPHAAQTSVLAALAHRLNLAIAGGDVDRQALLQAVPDVALGLEQIQEQAAQGSFSFGGGQHSETRCWFDCGGRGG